MPSENLSDGIFLPKQPYFLSGLQNLSETTETALPSFPRKRESKNPTRQKFIRNNKNFFIVIPAKAGIRNVKSKVTALPDKFPHRQT
ncbi:hypothetical protein [Neisseria lactamica]|uniref:hypothetical protein n=1 Tax=Neisseria lactamica TaxID=486 RepID=UPI0015F0A9C4|nr:hypothetical protein [Neisseria lactamica]